MSSSSAPCVQFPSTSTKALQPASLFSTLSPRSWMISFGTSTFSSYRSLFADSERQPGIPSSPCSTMLLLSATSLSQTLRASTNTAPLALAVTTLKSRSQATTSGCESSCAYYQPRVDYELSLTLILFLRSGDVGCKSAQVNACKRS